MEDQYHLACQVQYQGEQFSCFSEILPYIQAISDDKSRFHAEVCIVREAYKQVKHNERGFDTLLEYIKKDKKAHESAGYSYKKFTAIFQDELRFQRIYRTEQERKAISKQSIRSSWQASDEALRWLDTLPERLAESRSFLDAVKSFARHVWGWDEARGRINYQIHRRITCRGRGIRLERGVTTADISNARKWLQYPRPDNHPDAQLAVENINKDWLQGNDLRVNEFGIIDAAENVPDPHTFIPATLTEKAVQIYAEHISSGSGTRYGQQTASDLSIPEDKNPSSPGGSETDRAVAEDIARNNRKRDFQARADTTGGFRRFQRE
ncbi:hypothetical protein Hte_009941 [Hypoxylon texense]